MADQNPSTKNKRSARKTGTVAISDIDAKINALFSNIAVRPNRSLILRIREKVLSDALASITLASVLPLIEAEIKKLQASQ